jgi:hypothetical protein
MYNILNIARFAIARTMARPRLSPRICPGRITMKGVRTDVSVRMCDSGRILS